MRLLTADLPGTGGRVKVEPEDFRVDELPLYDPSGEGAHLLLRVEKRGMTTHEAAQRIARALRVTERDVGFAGIKDARAVTTQWFSVPAGCESRLEALVHPWLRVHERARHSSKLRVGELEGNRFEIVVRGTSEGSAAAVARARAVLDRLARRGMPNWFGEQRFGTKGDSDLLGRALVRGDCVNALRWYLGRPAPQEQDPRIREARRLFDEGKLEEAERSFPTRLRTEATVLHAYRQHGDAFRALFKIPKRLRLLFVSAYQARIFNRCLEARFDTLDRLLDGDVAVRHDLDRTVLVTDPAKEQPQADALALSPAGPIFGPGLPRARGEAARIEEQVFAAEELDPEERRQLFPDVHLRGERRAYRFPLRDATVEEHAALPDAIVVRFTLPRGCYATTVLAEITKSGPEANRPPDA
jgi:tRNA pseudouridine13 synthase